MSSRFPLGVALTAGLGLLAAFALPSSPSLPAVSAAPAAESFAVDGSHSFVVFGVSHLGVSYAYGRFNEISGSFDFDESAPAKSQIKIAIKAASIDTNNEGRDKHLKSPDFFNAEQFPEITFESKKVAHADGPIYKVDGELTLHGVTKPLTVQAELVGKGDRGQRFGYRAGFRTGFKIKRSDFGINYMPDGIGDEVEVTVSVEGVRK
jgi:polyisoprenoid-binding protein YceI